MNDDTFKRKKSTALNGRVKAFTPTANFGVCGAGYKTNTIGTKSIEYIFKSNCEAYALISKFTMTLD